MVRVYTPNSLLYPLKVKKLLLKPGDEIAKNAPLFVYEYKVIDKQEDLLTRELVDVERLQYSNFECEFAGTLTSFNVEAGQELMRRTFVAEVEEPCKHEVQYGGLCANCGMDVRDISSYNDTASLEMRATINSVHGSMDLKVSREEASKADEDAKRRLLGSRKLSLVVDLDQTVIHASVDPTIYEWQNDSSNPNHEALKDVRRFQLADENKNRTSTWYYIKLRPGLLDFLQTMSQYYEMHIYTMGTRAYADNIARLIDPERKIFGDRILSRDESGSLSVKDLTRLFPIDTKMVVIIDDRADVWQWISNLIKVNVYEFFVGIGDINGSFLPKRPELQATKSVKIETTSDKGSDPSSSDSASSDSASTAPTTPETNGETSAVAKMVNMAGKQDATTILTKEEEREQALTEQLEDRPLLKKQKELERLEEEEANASPAVEATKELLAEGNENREDTPAETPAKQKYRHNLLQDDDTELTFLEKNLRSIHEAYFEKYDKDTVGNKGSRVAELRPGHTKKVSLDDLNRVPDAAVIMDNLKQKVLSEVHLVFSGVVPLGVNIHNHDIALWAKSFGATVGEHITKKTTHVIASPERRTAKVRQAAKKGGRISIVSQSWLFACFSQWVKVDETEYRIHSDAPTNGTAGLPDSFDNRQYALSSSDEEATQTEDETDGGTATPNGTGNGLHLETDLDTDNEEWEKYKPTTPPDEISPTETAEEWGDIDDEIKDFIGSDADDSDTESTRSFADTEKLKTRPNQRKRKSNEVEDSEDEVERSRLQKRKRQALDRTTSLTNIATAQTDSEAGENQDPGGGEETDDEDDLEAQLAAEFAADGDDEEQEAAEENGGGKAALQ